MEEFEYSVDVCDQDWTSFVVECEECNLLPPSLARLDDSGMSDIDDKAGFVYEVDPPPGRYLSKHGVTGMESILSGSEEDIHLQSVNVFFERLKAASEAEKLAEPNQTRQPTQREVKREGGHRSDGQRANNAALTGNIPNVNVLAATGKAAVAEATEPDGFTSSIVETQKEDEDGDGIPTKPAGSTSGFKSLEPVQTDELKQADHSSDAEGKVADLRTPPNTVEQDQFPPNRGFADASRSHVDMKRKDADFTASLSDSTDASKTASRESSSSSSVRRKRAKKRRPEPAGRQVFVKPSDSEEEQQARRGGIGVRVANESRLYDLKVRRPTSEYSTISSLPPKLSARERNVNDLPQGQHSESILRRSRVNGARLTEIGAGDDRSVIPLSQTVMSVLKRSGHVAKPSHPGRRLHEEEDMIHMFCCENEQRRNGQTHERSAANSLLAGGAGNSGIQWHHALTGQYGSRLGQSCPSLSTSDSPDTKSNHMDRTKSINFNSLPHKRSPSPQQPNSARSPGLPPSPDEEAACGRSTVAERAGTPAAVPPELQICEHSLASLTDITPVSSCCTLDTESGLSLSNGNITDLSYSSCLSVSQNDSRCSGEKTPPTKQQEEEEERRVPEADDAAAPAEGKPEDAPDSTHSVFAMSSFWSEMEKLTINDILGLRKMEQTASLSSRPPLKEDEKPAEFDLTDPGLYADELKPGQTSVPVPPERPPLPARQSANGYGGTVIPGGEGLDSRSGPTSFRRICKTVSMQNLCSLESVRFREKHQTLPSLDEEDLEKVGRFPDGPMSNKEEDGYSISLGGIFQYIFGKQSDPQCYTGNASSIRTDGRSLPETYDHFMSDSPAESIFDPFVPVRHRAKDAPRSASRTLQFPEAYEYFFASSSSDESPAESDGEDDSGPGRAVERLRRTSNASDLSTDIYDHFFTDCDFEQSSFWENSFSFRNLFTGSTENQRTVSGSFVPRTPSGFQITVNSVEAPDNQDWMFSDLYPVEDGLSDVLPPRPFTYEDLQVAVPSPSKSSYITHHHRSAEHVLQQFFWVPRCSGTAWQ